MTKAIGIKKAVETCKGVDVALIKYQGLLKYLDDLCSISIKKNPIQKIKAYKTMITEYQKIK